MIEEAKELIATSSPQSSVYIGCDSIRYRKNNQWYAKYSTVIIVHMDSKHVVDCSTSLMICLIMAI